MSDRWPGWWDFSLIIGWGALIMQQAAELDFFLRPCIGLVCQHVLVHFATDGLPLEASAPPKGIAWP